MIKSLKELTKDSLTYGTATMLGQIIGFFLLPLYTSYLTATDYGVMGLLGYISIFFPKIAALGVNHAIFRRFNLLKEKKEQIVSLSTGIIFVLISSTAFFLLCYSLSRPITKFLVTDIDQYLHLVHLVLVTSLLMSVANMFVTTLRAQRKVKVLATFKVIELLLTIGFTVYFIVFANRGIEGVFLGRLIGVSFSAIGQFLMAIRMLSFTFSYTELVKMLKYGLPYVPHRLLNVLRSFLVLYFIKTFLGLEETGIYNIAAKFIIPLTFIVGSIQSAWTPIKFQISREEGEDAPKTLGQLTSVNILVITSIFLCLVVSAPEILRLLVDPKFYPAAFMIPIILLEPIAQSTYYLLGSGFGMTDNTKGYPLVSGLGLVSFVVLAFLLYHLIGTYGILLAIPFSWFIMTTHIRILANSRYYIPINSLILKSTLTLIGIQTINMFFIQSFPFGLRVIIESISLLISLFFIAVLYKNAKEIHVFPFHKYPVLQKLKVKFEWVLEKISFLKKANLKSKL